MSVQYCLCVSRIQECIQCSVSVYSVGSVTQRSMQVVFSSVSKPFSCRVCSIHSQWCSVLAGLQSTAFMVCLLLFSVGSVQSTQLSVGFRVYSVQCQFSVCSVQGVYCSVGHSPSVLFSVCSVQSTGCSPRVCHVHVMFRVHTLKVLCPMRSS